MDHIQHGALGARIARRAVVASGGAAAAGLALTSTPAGANLVARLATAGAAKDASNVIVERVRRPDDQLAMDIVFIDMARSESGDGSIHIAPNGNQDGYIAFVLPGQAIGEGLSTGFTLLPNSAYVGSEMAPPTVLAFKVPAGHDFIYDLPSLLDWSGLSPWWESTNADWPRSFVEAPYRFRLKPHPSLLWKHATEPFQTRAGGGGAAAEGQDVLTELWHTRLEVATDDGEPIEGAATQRIIAVTGTAKTTLGIAVDKSDRDAVVTQANTFTTSSASAPVRADLFLLSPLGASLDLHGSWPGAAKLISWDHRSTLGRDQYVKTVNRGFLAPWGHPAVLIEETARRMKVVNNRPIAVLEKVVTLVITDPVVDTSVEFARKSGSKTAGSRFPFTTIRCLDRQSPPLEQRNLSQLKNAGGVPKIKANQLNLTMQFAGTDWNGEVSAFTSVVGFVPGDAGKSQKICQGWNSEPEKTVRTVDFGGQSMAMAPVLGAPGSTSLATGACPVNVTWIPPSVLGSRKRAPFRPFLLTVNVTVPAMAALSGKGQIAHTWASAYTGDQANPGGVVLKATTPPASGVTAEKTGGMAPLPAKYQGFSATSGAVIASTPDALTGLAANTFNAEKIYGDITLLGQIPLAKIVKNTAAAMPQSVTEVVNGRQVVTTTMTPALKDYSATPFYFKAGSLSIVTTIAAGGDQPAEHTVEAVLTGSAVQLAGLVVLPINQMRVTSTTGAPFDLDLDLGEVQFLGPLGFVQSLVEVLQPLLEAAAARPGSATRPSGSGAAGRHTPAAKAGPDVSADLAGIHISQTLAFPDVGVGVFTLSGLNFGLGMDLLFSGSWLTRFNFASHESPFQVRYGPFGGGGYCALAMDGGDVSNLEVSLMACGGIGINLGVAAGAISVSAGFVLALPAGKPVSVTAFFRASGALEVLGLVSVSVVFEIALAFVDSDPSSLTGTATLAMKVEVCWVSKTVHASVSQTFAGGSKGSKLGRGAGGRSEVDDTISFRDIYPDQPTWQSYTGAFASMGA